MAQVCAQYVERPVPRSCLTSLGWLVGWPASLADDSAGRGLPLDCEDVHRCWFSIATTQARPAAALAIRRGMGEGGSGGRRGRKISDAPPTTTTTTHSPTPTRTPLYRPLPQLGVAFFAPLLVAYHIEQRARRQFVRALRPDADTVTSWRMSHALAIAQAGWGTYCAIHFAVFGWL